MPIAYLLYRCPKCGEDPTENKGEEARCPTCGTRYLRGREGGTIRILESSGEVWEVSSGRLTAALDVLGGPRPRARRQDGRISYRAEVSVREAKREEPVWYKGELQGFAERLEGGLEGILQITVQDLTLWPSDAVGRGSPLRRWGLLDIRAVQTSSSSLQISPREGGLVQFRFQVDSPRRWEDLLRRTLQEAYQRDGRGTIVEFQPRIVVEGP